MLEDLKIEAVGQNFVETLEMLFLSLFTRRRCTNAR